MGTKYKFYDERLSADKIGNLIEIRPTNYKWKNFGIWYGTYKENKGFFYCSNVDCSIEKSCCTGWTCPNVGCYKN